MDGWIYIQNIHNYIMNRKYYLSNRQTERDKLKNLILSLMNSQQKY